MNAMNVLIFMMVRNNAGRAGCEDRLSDHEKRWPGWTAGRGIQSKFHRVSSLRLGWAFQRTSNSDDGCSCSAPAAGSVVPASLCAHSLTPAPPRNTGSLSRRRPSSSALELQSKTDNWPALLLSLITRIGQQFAGIGRDTHWV